MTSDDAIGRLRQLIAEAGVHERQPSVEDVDRTWAVMRQFAAEPVEDADSLEDGGDAILAQYGVYDWGAGEYFELDMTRQFSFSDEDGEYDHMSQLHCTFRFQPTDALRGLGERNLWSFGRSLDEFFDEALAMPGFQHTNSAKLAPVSLEIDYSEV